MPVGDGKAHIRRYSPSIAAGATHDIYVPHTWVLVDFAGTDGEIEIGINDGSLAAIKPQMSLELPREQTKLTLRNTSGGTIAVQVWTSDGKIEFHGTEIAGTVSVADVGASSFDADSVTVTTTATEIRPVNTDRKALTIYNHGASTVFVGPAGVTTASGLPVLPSVPFDVPGTDEIYGIVASGSVDVRWFEGE